MTEPLTSSDVQAALDEQAPGIQVETYDTSTATAPQAAASIGTPLGSIVKSLVFMINGRPIVALVAGDQKVDTRKIAAFYDVGRKKVKIATYEECVEHIGYEPGGVPPLGHRSAAPILIDRSLSRFETVYAAAGSPNTIFPIP
ncbi:MAG: YbaK/EbsC family protein, partial [Chloroflexi bacterium]|nr:YbaK/EbsC family protein [Chloroflexota bacterium]